MLSSRLPVAIPIVVGAFSNRASAHESDSAFGHHMMWSSWGWDGMIFGPLGMIIIIAAAIAALLFFLRWLGASPQGSVPMTSGSASSKALDILNERYARGEIDKDEFEDRRKALKGVVT